MKRLNLSNIIIVWVLVLINLLTNTPLSAQEDVACYVYRRVSCSYVFGFDGKKSYTTNTYDWCQHPLGTNLSYEFDGLICTMTLYLTVANSGTDSDSDCCSVNDMERKGSEGFNVIATFYTMPKLIADFESVNCISDESKKEFTFSVDNPSNPLFIGNKDSTIYLQIADNTEFDNARKIPLPSGTATLSYSELAGLNTSAWYGKVLSCRLLLLMANGDYLSGPIIYPQPAFFPKFTLNGTLSITPPVCSGGTPIISIPAATENDNYIITISENWTGGSVWNFVSGNIKNGSNYIITNDTPSANINGDKPTFLEGASYLIKIEHASANDNSTPCAYQDNFSIPNIPQFILSAGTYEFDQPDNNNQQVQIRKFGGKGLVNFFVGESGSPNVTIFSGSFSQDHTLPISSYNASDKRYYYSGNIFIDLPAKVSHEIIVKNDNGCFSNKIYKGLAEPAPITFTLSATNISCHTSCVSGDTANGTITVNGLSGGIGTLSASISPSPPSANYSNGIFTGLSYSATGYTVTITDAEDNKTSVHRDVLQPLPLTFKIDKTNAPLLSCFLNGGSVEVSNPSGGAGNGYKYSCNKDSDFQSSTVVRGFSAGIRPVYIKDANSCVATKNVIIPLAPPEMFISTQNSTPPKCFEQNDGQYQCTVSNVFGTFSVTDLDARISLSSISIVGNSLTISGLGAGSYTLTLVDTKNELSCSKPITFTVVQKQAISVTSSVSNVKGQGTATGSVIVTASGGNSGGYKFFIYDENMQPLETKDTSSNNVTFNNLSGSSSNGGKLYYVNVTDNSSCSYYNDNLNSYYQVRILEPLYKLELKYSIKKPIDCYGNSNAEVELSASKGWGQPYLFSKDNIKWTDTTTFIGFSAGKHTFYVTDKNGGKASVEVFFSQPPKLTATLDSTRNVLCKGTNTGWLRYNVSGGTFPYSFFPPNGLSSKFRGEDTLLTATNLSAQKWTFQIKDKNGCLTNSFDNEVTQPELLTIPFTDIKHTSCELNNGGLQAKASGGTAPYKYYWTSSAGDFEKTEVGLSVSDTSKVNKLKAGTYNVVVTDKNNCSVTRSSLTIDAYTNPAIIGDVKEKVRCYGESNGTIKVTAQGGKSAIAKYTLSAQNLAYSDTNTTGYFENLKADTYNLYVIDVKGCSSNLPRKVNIIQPDLLYLKLGQIQSVLNKGSNTGGIQATVFGGNDRLKEVKITKLDSAWSSTSNQRNDFPFILDKLNAGSYKILATDSKGCSDSLDNIIVAEPQFPLKFKDVIVKNALCKAKTGSIEVQAEGGWGDYTYNGPTYGTNFYPGGKFENLLAGSYIITVKDKLEATFSDTVTIYEPKDSLRSWVSDFKLPTCSNNGEIKLAFKGGTAPYQVFDSTNRFKYPSTSEKEFTVKGLNANNYIMRITDGNGCLYDLDAKLSKTQMLDVSFGNPEYPSVNNKSDGSIHAVATGGVGPLEYSWKQRFGSAFAETSSSLKNIPSGHYELTVTEKGGCSVTKTYYLPGIGNHPFEIAEIENETSLNAKNGYCNLTSLFNNWKEFDFITPPNDMVHLNSGDSNSQFSCVGNTVFLKNLEGGTYFVSGIADDTTRVYAEFFIESYTPFNVKSTIVENVKKIGDSNGRISLTVEGGGGENHFDWKRISPPQSSTLATQDSPEGSILSNITAGKYEATITDKFKNVISQTIDVIEPSQPLKVTISDSKNVSCKNYNNGSVTLNASGGWGDYQFKDDIEANYFNGNLQKDKNQFVNLTSRSHDFSIIDRLGVVESVSIQITEPDYLRSTAVFVDSVNCKGDATGEVKFHVTGGTKPYKFAYDSNPTFWETDTVARNVPFGEYNYIFKDANNCPTQSVIPPVKMLEPESLLFSKINVTHTTCNTDNGKINVNLKGGSKPYRYEWYDFSNALIGSVDSIDQLKQNGCYTLKVYDKYNCYQQLDTTIQSSSNPVITDLDATAVLCYEGNTGTATVKTVKAGNPYAPYTFKWSNGDNGTVSKGYKKGAYSVTVTDTNKCTTTKYFEITQPDLLRISIADSKNAHCFGYNDAFLEAKGIGGVGSYAYQWSTGETTNLIKNLYKGVYSLKLSDANKCETNASFTINEPEKLEVDLGKDIRLCPGNKYNLDGQDFTTYQWSTKHDTLSKERYIAVGEEADYYLEVTDSIGCFAWDTINVSFGNDALKSDFLLSSQAILGDTLSVFELSNMVLDSLQWNYNNNAFSKVDGKPDLNYMLFLKTLKTGIYNIDLSAFSGGCISKSTKQVEIIPDTIPHPDDGDLGYKDPLIKSFSVNPNPTDGNFYASVKLREASDINLVLFSVVSGVKINEKSGSKQQEYSIGYNLSGLNTGFYLLILKVGNERRQVKIIIQ